MENGTRAPILAEWPTYVAQNMEDLFAGILCLILSDIQAYYQYNFPVLYNFDIESDIAKKMTKTVLRFISQLPISDICKLQHA